MKSWPMFTDEEQDAVLSVLRSGKVNYWTGCEGKLFEEEFTKYIGVNHAIACANGTVALELCLRSLNIGPGDEVIVTSRTFLASVSVIVGCGATPIFADVDLESQNITVDTIDAVLTSKTKAIIAVHLAGWPCAMPEIMAYAKTRNLFVIEDCAQAHGASIDGKKVGSWGHMAAFSFCQDKIMTTGGEGGMVTTNDHQLWNSAWSYKDHGKCYDAVYNKQHPPGFRWLHNSFGTNYRMTEMQAAIGRVQLRNLDNMLDKRMRLATLIQERLTKLPYLRMPTPPAKIRHANYKVYGFIIPEKIPDNVTRSYVKTIFREHSITCMDGSCSEVYLEQCFTNHSSKPKQRLTNARILGETSLMFLCHPTIDPQLLANNLTQAIDCLLNNNTTHQIAAHE